MVKDSSVTNYVKTFKLRLNVGRAIVKDNGQWTMYNGQWTSGPVCFKINDCNLGVIDEQNET
jgi:hypothetical protein